MSRSALLHIGYYKNEMFDNALEIVGIFKNFFDLFSLYDVTYEYRDYSNIENSQYFGSVEIDECINCFDNDAEYQLYDIVEQMILAKDIDNVTKLFNLFGTKQQNINKIKIFTSKYRIVVKGQMFKILKAI